MNYNIPVDPISIAKSHGITVLAKNDLGDISGSICNNNGHITIEYNKNENKLRQRFTVAHELGHYLSGHVDTNNKCFRDSSQSYSKNHYDFQEVEANRRAAEILMPEEVLKHIIFSEGITNITDLSQKFIVSELAMQYRLKNLGWIN
jgi:Zn-dependent peptidase ImmA (M78 family)